EGGGGEGGEGERCGGRGSRGWRAGAGGGRLRGRRQVPVEVHLVRREGEADRLGRGVELDVTLQRQRRLVRAGRRVGDLELHPRQRIALLFQVGTVLTGQVHLVIRLWLARV